MNYLEWNNAIISYFFNPKNEEKEVFLYFSEKIIEEIGNENFPKPKNGYIQDFFTALRKGVPGYINDDYIQRIIELDVKSSGILKIDEIPFNYPPFLTYLITFILPFTSGNIDHELNVNNFHDNAKNFFEEKNLTDDYHRKIKYKLSEVDELWKKVNDWLIEENNFSLGYLEELSPPRNRKYVQKLLYHALFRKEQEERLSKVFDNYDILPGDLLKEEKVRDLLIKNKCFLRLSDDTCNLIKNKKDYTGNKIISRVLRYFNEWDGTVYTIDNQRSYSRSRLALCANFNTLKKTINLKYFRIYSSRGIPENSTLSKPDRGIIKGIHQVKEFYSNPIEGCFKDLATDIELKDEANRIRYSWKTKPFLLFKRVPHFEWVEIQELEFNIGKTLIICRECFYEIHFEKWFEDIKEGKQLLTDSNRTLLPAGWLAFTVDKITQYPNPELSVRETGQNNPQINFDRSFYSSGTFYNNMPPSVWVERAETNENIAARYGDKKIALVNSVSYEENGEILNTNRFEFTEEHLRRNEAFKLVCGDIESHQFFKFMAFEKSNNETIESFLPKRNAIGQITNQAENYVKGVEHFFSEERVRDLKPRQRLLDEQHIFKNKTQASYSTTNKTYDPNHLGNILIHYISAKGKLSKKEFDNTVFRLLENTEEEGDIKKRANYLRYQLQDAGLIDYNPERSMVVVNKPHLLIRPTENGTSTFLTGSRDQQFVQKIFEYCEEHKMYVDVQNDNDPLFPQIIFINSSGIRHEELSILANRFGILFKKDGLYTQFALTSFLGAINQWQNYIFPLTEQIPDFEGGYLFSIEVLRFINKPENFDKSLALTKFTEINGYKSVYRLWYRNEAYNIPDQQIGIYLFLYLYKTVREDNCRECLSKYDRINCQEEIEEKEQASQLANIILYDEKNKNLAVPLNCRLPRFFSESLALLSGKKPEVKYLNIEGVQHKGTYLIYKNVYSLFVKNELKERLKQNLINTEIEINK